MEESVLRAFGVSVALFAGYLFLRTSQYRRFRAEHLRTDRGYRKQSSTRNVGPAGAARRGTTSARGIASAWRHV
jgi:hypothetical protein